MFVLGPSGDTPRPGADAAMDGGVAATERARVAEAAEGLIYAGAAEQVRKTNFSNGCAMQFHA